MFLVKTFFVFDRVEKSLHFQFYQYAIAWRSCCIPNSCQQLNAKVIAFLIYINNCVGTWLHSQFLSTIVWKSHCILNSYQQLFSRNLYLIFTLSMVDVNCKQFLLFLDLQDSRTCRFLLHNVEQRCIYLRAVCAFYNRYYEKEHVQNVNFVNFFKYYCIILIQIKKKWFKILKNMFY